MFCFWILCVFPDSDGLVCWGNGRRGSFVFVFFPMAVGYVLVLIQAAHSLKLTFLLRYLPLWCISREPCHPSLFCFGFNRLQNLGFLCCCPTVRCRTDTYTRILAGTELSRSRTQSSSSVPQLTNLAESIWPCSCNFTYFRMWDGVSMQETQQQREGVFSWK